MYINHKISSQQDCVRVYQALQRLPSFTDVLTGYQENHHELIRDCFTTPLKVIWHVDCPYYIDVM